MRSTPYIAARATAAAAPPLTHWAFPVIMGIPPVLTFDLPVELPVGLLVGLPAELPVEIPVELPVEPPVVWAAVEATVGAPVEPGAAAPSTMVTAWAPRSVA
jgi:hypothetical protein